MISETHIYEDYKSELDITELSWAPLTSSVSFLQELHSPTVTFYYFVGTKDTVYLGIVLVGMTSHQLDVLKNAPDSVEMQHKNHWKHLNKSK